MVAIASRKAESVRPFRDAREGVRTGGATVCDVKARCWESSAMDAAEECGERRRMQARDDVDDGVGCGGVAWVSWLSGVRAGFGAGLSAPAPARLRL